MWKTNIIGKEQIWYSEEEYKEVVDKFNKIMYNIEKALKERHDWIAIQIIEEEVEKWKKSMSAENAETNTEMQ